MSRAIDLLQKQQALEQQTPDGVPSELSLKGTEGYSYQGTKKYQGKGRYYINGKRAALYPEPQTPA